MAKRPEKKSETLEVRLPYSQKQAFMATCRDQAITASDVVRGLIEDFMRVDPSPAEVAPAPVRQWAMTFRDHPKMTSMAAAGLSGLALMMGTAPAAAEEGTAARLTPTQDTSLTIEGDLAAPGAEILSREEMSATAEVKRIENQRVRIEGEEMRILKGTKAQYDLLDDTLTTVNFFSITERLPLDATAEHIATARADVERRLDAAKAS